MGRIAIVTDSVANLPPDVAEELGIRIVPVVGHGTLSDAVAVTRDGFDSVFGAFPAEGLVMRPTLELKNRQGHRIISKVKTKDFA